MEIENALLTLEILELKEKIQHQQDQPQKSKAESERIRLHWDVAQDELLLKLVKTFGPRNCKEISEEMKSRTEKQVYFRLRYLTDLYHRNNAKKLSADWKQYLSKIQLVVE
ncbi:SANT/Myb_domain [Hexamita inflata]|uniref:SANT/Myb domain n=1 Tax=Hexamita inflata TaxID=28002 RepID=A0AA86NBP0_9EUKA|nr:SANT/Myb domain [Hexamita inflata]CAI9916765.1 SANT/Myb domain [Hexamita inflata]CAI9916768.1 SANT/Myb domain [Hexamita inflata]